MHGVGEGVLSPAARPHATRLQGPTHVGLWYTCHSRRALSIPCLGLCFCHCTVSSFRAQTIAHPVLLTLKRPRKAPPFTVLDHSTVGGGGARNLQTCTRTRVHSRAPCAHTHQIVSGTFHHQLPSRCPAVNPIVLLCLRSFPYGEVSGTKKPLHRQVPPILGLFLLLLWFCSKAKVL